jgi:hypothetical protein
LRNRSEPTLPNLVSLLKHSEVLYHLLYMMGILVVRGLWNITRSFQGPSRVSESRPGIAIIGAIADLFAGPPARFLTRGIGRISAESTRGAEG